MPFAFQVLLILAALLGHAVLWVGIVNRIHGVGISRWLVDSITLACVIAFFAVPLAALIGVVGGMPLPTLFVGSGGGLAITRYAELCVLLLIASAGYRWWLSAHTERSGALVSESADEVELAAAQRGDVTVLAAEGVPRTLARMPGNQLLRPVLTRKELAIPRLPQALDGLTIAHLTDLHMSGRVRMEYFRELVELTNTESPDLIALTGDLVEYDPQLAWVEETLAQLTASEGVYFVRGNHDKKMDHARLRSALAAAGHVDLCHAWSDRDVRGCKIRFVGNELPWFPPAGDPVGDGAAVDIKIALAHGPDQFGWAVDNDLDLILAGHNHGGQIRLPLLGAVVTPSTHGTRYNSGVFRRGETVMHVSRGVGSLAPLRFNCRPELAILTLRTPKKTVS